MAGTSPAMTAALSRPHAEERPRGRVSTHAGRTTLRRLRRYPAMAGERIEQEQHFWNGIALIVYAVLCALSVWLVARYGTLDPAAVGFLDLVPLGLAAFRLIHLLTYDKIFDVVRAAFMDRKGARLKNAERGWRRLMCEFMQCIWCTGMWSGLIVVTV